MCPSSATIGCMAHSRPVSPPGTQFPHTNSEPRAVLRSGEALVRRCVLGSGLCYPHAAPQGHWLSWTPPFVEPKTPRDLRPVRLRAAQFQPVDPWRGLFGCSGRGGGMPYFGIILQVQENGKGRAESFCRLLNGFPSRSRSGEGSTHVTAENVTGFPTGPFSCSAAASSTSRCTEASQPLRFAI